MSDLSLNDAVINKDIAATIAQLQDEDNAMIIVHTSTLIEVQDILIDMDRSHEEIPGIKDLLYLFRDLRRVLESFRA